MRTISKLRPQILMAVIFTFILSLAVLSSPNLNAQEEAPSNAVKLSPLILEYEVDPGEVINADIRVENTTSQQLKTVTAVNDFVADSEESGSPRILLDDTQGESSFSVKNYIQVAEEVVIEPGQSVDVPITITVPTDASPGGHFGIVRFTTQQDKGDENVSLSASAGTLVLLDVSGDRIERVGIEQFGATSDGEFSGLFSSAPISLSARVSNEGNVQLKPIGTISLEKTFGDRETIEFNESRANVLPDSIRRFDIEKEDLGIGRYTATLNLSYGNGGDIITSTATFWILPFGAIIGGVVGLVVLVGVVVVGLRKYKDKILANSKR